MQVQHVIIEKDMQTTFDISCSWTMIATIIVFIDAAPKQTRVRMRMCVTCKTLLLLYTLKIYFCTFLFLVRERYISTLRKIFMSAHIYQKLQSFLDMKTQFTWTPENGDQSPSLQNLVSC